MLAIAAIQKPCARNAGQKVSFARHDDGHCGINSQCPQACREFPEFMENVIREDGSLNPECVCLRIFHGIAAWLPNPAITAATEVLL